MALKLSDLNVLPLESLLQLCVQVAQPSCVYLKDLEKTYGWSRAVEKLDIDMELSTKFDIK